MAADRAFRLDARACAGDAARAGGGPLDTADLLAPRSARSATPVAVGFRRARRSQRGGRLPVRADPLHGRNEPGARNVRPEVAQILVDCDVGSTVINSLKGTATP